MDKVNNVIVTDSYENAINLDVIEEIIEYKIFI